MSGRFSTIQSKWGQLSEQAPTLQRVWGSRAENCINDFFDFRNIDPREPVVPDIAKVAHASKNILVGWRVVQSSDADGAGAGVSPSVLLRKPPPEDALRNRLASSGQESSAQEPEEALIDRILSGHKELFMDLVRPHQRTVYAMVFSLLVNKEDVEDVAQDTLVKTLARLHQFRKESTFGTWLIQIAINEVRMRNRKQWRVPMLSMTGRKDDGKAHVPKDFEDWREIPSTAPERVEVREALAKALDGGLSFLGLIQFCALTSLGFHQRCVFRNLYESRDSHLLQASVSSVSVRPH